MINLGNYVNLTKPIHIAKKHSNIDGIYGPYNSYQEALNAFNDESSPIYNLLDLGLTVGVIENGKLIEYWWLNNGTELTLVYKNTAQYSPDDPANPGTTVAQGIPIFTNSEATRLGLNNDEYISIPDDVDLLSYVTNNTYNTSINGLLANVLFSAIRQLQSEVNKLKNSFDYGIYSYSGKNTAMSRINSEYDEEQEPLWAIDDDGVSLIKDVINDSVVLNNFTPSSNITVIDENSVHFNNEGVVWNWDADEIEDSKILLYFTTTGKNIIINLLSLSSNLNLNLDLIVNTNLDIYNILVVISRKLIVDSVEYGRNFIWISIDNPVNNETILEGYYNNGIFTDIKELGYRYDVSSIHFSDLTLSRFKICSKYQDFSKEIIPSKPTDSKYSYKAAHITIRSVDTYATLDEIKDQLPENELIFVEDNQKLYIKNNYRVVAISGSNQQIIDDGMTAEETRQEVIRLLEEKGIIISEENGISLNDISDITFIHLDTGAKFKVLIDNEGNLKTSPISDVSLLDKIKTSFGLEATSVGDDQNYRGFVGRLGLAYQHATKGPTEAALSVTKDIRLYSDRVKIGSFYAPSQLSPTYGCSHCFIELENTSDMDFPLEGCYLHYARTVDDAVKTSHLALTGILPKNGTYLIRCAKKSEFDDPNTFIKVETFDLEWYEDGELIDLSHNGVVSDNKGNDPHGFALTYGKPELAYNETICSANPTPTDKTKYLYYPCYIDAVYYNATFLYGDVPYWTVSNIKMSCIINGKFKDYICKNTFELDPAKLAYLALSTYDSSRYRHQTENDYQYVLLDTEYIEFPKTEERYPVSKFTPKASFEHKNVCTDKTLLDLDKPNMVTCSFGKNPYTTRCFNWISGGLFDEYVWIKQGANWVKFESYKEGDLSQTLVGGPLQRKEFSNADIINCIYKRITGRFPAANTQYTSHKCIINITTDAVGSPTEYTYIVGRADKNGDPDLEHCSEEYKFTLYPTSYIPRIYQVTDLLGFHWIEYLSWATAANEVYNRIKADLRTENIIPVLVNTGDMTLSGARINEWLDYYNAGKVLFKEFEQLNVVGNNDLCGTNPEELGTGDDDGKSNSFYFHVFYCYEVETESGMIPIINNKYIPSLYKVKFNNYCTLLLVNSEITKINCRDWFKKYVSNPSNSSELIPINVYTGWTIDGDNSVYNNSFTSIYTMIYNMTDNESNIIAVCHEMPFTVITNENLNTTTKLNWRSLSGNSLVGSHLNLIDVNDKVGTHWFSRLLEYRKCKLCIGGHKHTYAITYPIRENYAYTKEYNVSSQLYDTVDKTSKTNGPMTMGPTLENDNSVVWINGDRNLSKFPLTTSTVPELSSGSTIFYPVEHVDSFVNKDGYTSGIIYFMCLATGFKLMSNKELPSPDLKFSLYLPKSNVSDSKADKELRYPMYAIIKLGDTWNIKLIRLKNILSGPTVLFSLINYGTSSTLPLYLYDNSSSSNPEEWKYGGWSVTESNIIEI